ncbi:hypothetical protein C8Q80DRAFT_347190 [Daedaleopsis nitida]|nr:hypothetical protein C8Q80DRAFT_347190 [Daedaleopsis nitida]
MLAMLAIYTTAVFSILAAANPVPQGASPGMCSTGSLQCCNKVMSYSDVRRHGLESLLLGPDLGSADGFVGGSCSPLEVVAVATKACSGTAVCCDNKSYGRLISASAQHI